MQAIRDRNTKPERRLRSALHRAGFRFRLHRLSLPGKPDIVLPRYQTAIFVHGCFWHSHGCPRGGKGPKSNLGYWNPKFERTKERDQKNRDALEKLGWNVIVVWECELKQVSAVIDGIKTSLAAASGDSQP